MSRVKNFKVDTVGPKTSDKLVAALLPTVNVPVRCSMELHGVNVAIANGLRRVLMSELPAMRMTFAHDSFHTNDPFMKVDYIRDRIYNIPVRQDNPNATWKLHKVNDTAMGMRIKTRDLIGTKGLFNETFDVALIGSNRFITIDKIYLQKGYGYNHAGHSLAFAVSSVPLDQTPYDQHTGEGVRSSVSDPRVHRLAFTTNGTMDPKKIVLLACSELVTRLNAVIKAIPSINHANDTYHLVLNNESDTVGNILVKGLVETYPDITAATYSMDDIVRSITVSVRTDDDLESMLIDVCKKNIKVVESIATHFR